MGLFDDFVEAGKNVLSGDANSKDWATTIGGLGAGPVGAYLGRETGGSSGLLGTGGSQRAREGAASANRFEQARQSHLEAIKNDPDFDEITRQELLQRVGSGDFTDGGFSAQLSQDILGEISKAKNKEGKYAIRGFLQSRRETLADMPGRSQLLDPGRSKVQSNPNDFNNAVKGKDAGTTAVRELKDTADDASPENTSQKIAATTEGRGLYRRRKTQSLADRQENPIGGGTSVL